MEAKVRRQFTVLKDTGEYFHMNYTSSGVNWVRIDGTADAGGAPPAPSDTPPAESAARATTAGLNAMQAIGSLAPAIGQVVQAAALAGLWWEDRQRRLLDEAKQEESRRIAWLADMTARWGAVHQAGDHLNFRVTEHLAREAKATMDALLSNKRVSIPQSVLCEVGIIQDAIGSFRSVLLTQFEELAANDALDLEEVVRQALPGRRLDMDFVRQLGQDPANALESPVRPKPRAFDKTKEFIHPDFSEVLIDATGFTDRVFPSTLPAIPSLGEPHRQLGFFDQLSALVAGALAYLPTEEVNPEAVERRTTFRELTLLPAEVLRVRALNSAWLATSAIVAESAGSEVAVSLGTKGVRVELESAPGRRELTGRASATDS